MLDWKTALSFAGGGNIMGMVGGGLGLPSCLTDLTSAVLSMLPKSVLNEMAFASQEAQAELDAMLSGMSDSLSAMFGLDSVTTGNGELSFISRNSGLGSLMAGAGYLAGAAQFGAAMYAEGMAIAGSIESATACLKSLSDSNKFKGAGGYKASGGLDQGEFEGLVNSKAAPLLAQIAEVEEEKQKWVDLEKRIDGIVDEPLFACVEVDIEGNPVHLSSLGFSVSCGPEAEKDLIRLVFGPPMAREGQFIFSNDGLYYDSQSAEASGVTQVLLHLDKRKSEVPLADRWTFKHDPNIGGKGVQYSSKSVSYYVDTIFDPEIIDESPEVRRYYDADHFLEVLESQKVKRIYDLSSHIAEFEAGDAGTAIIQNAKQSLYSEISIFERRINKRKKQLELAVKMPMIYGGIPIFSPGEVPLNDFSYLQQFNFANDIHKQKALVLDQADVTGVVIPVSPKFVVSDPKDEVQNMEHMYIADIGKGEILYSNSASSTVAPKLSVTDRISSRGLFAIYNYLESNVVSPSSNEFNVANCATQDVYNNAQLVSNNASSIFVSGISIPNLTGVTKQISGDTFNVSNSGNFVKLPESPEFHDLTYNIEGFTFESWMHVPNLTKVTEGWTDNGASSLYRLVLANENAGMTPGISAQTDPERLEKDLGDGFVKGMIMGFTRDRRLTKKLEHSILSRDNLPTSSLAFFVAPTQAVNDTSVGLIHNGCAWDSSPDWLSFTVDASTVSTGGHKHLLSGADQFILASLVMDPSKDVVSLYVNGDLMATSSLTSTFGRDKYNPVEVPSFYKPDSHNYVPSNLTVSASLDIQGGPRLGGYFTPTILGGGYTDGIGGKGFMGNQTYGAISGLRGFLGSTKFYERALSSREVLNNYNAQKEVFENISTTSTYSESGS